MNMDSNEYVDESNLMENFEHLFIALIELTRHEIKHNDMSFVIFVLILTYFVSHSNVNIWFDSIYKQTSSFLLPDDYPLTSLLQEYYVHEEKKTQERGREEEKYRKKKKKRRYRI